MDKTESNLLTTIKSVLLSKNISPTPLNIANAGLETVVRLHSKGGSDFKDLLDTVASTGAFALNETALKALRLTLSSNSLSWCSILKHFLQSRPHPVAISDFPELFKLLVDNLKSKGISSLVTKSFQISGCLHICDLETTVQLLSNCMGALFDTFDAVEFIACNSLESATVNTILLSYLRVNDDRNGHIGTKTLLKIIGCMSPLQPGTLEMLILLLTCHKNNVLRLKEKESIFTPKLVEIIRNEVLEAEHPDNELAPLISLLSGSILPVFTSLLVEVNEKFLTDRKHLKLLQNMISYITIQDFADVVGSVDIQKHCAVFKGLSNVDLSVFFGMYRAYTRGTEFEQLDLDYTKANPIVCIHTVAATDAINCLLSCLPSFCYYCTDQYGNAENLIKILEHHVNTHPTVVAAAVEKLIYSQSSNLTDVLHLNNPINRSESANLLTALRESVVLHGLVQRFIQCDTFECASALQMLIRLCGVDMSGQIIPVILGDEQSTLSLHGALRLMIFFVECNTFDFDFISRLLELCSSPEPGLQKKAYQLLCSIYSMRRTSVCICDILYTSLAKSLNISAGKQRLELLATIIKNGCKDCKIESRERMVDKFVSEVVQGLVVGNVKRRKMAKEVVVEMAGDEYFLRYLLEYVFRKTNDTTLMCGCVVAAQELLEHASVECYDGGLDKEAVIRALMSVATHSQQVAKYAIKAFGFIVTRPELGGFYGEMSKAVEAYISQFSRKMNAELKEFCIRAQKAGQPLSRSMKGLLRYRNKGGKGGDVLLVKKTEFNDLL